MILCVGSCRRDKFVFGIFFFFSPYSSSFFFVICVSLSLPFFDKLDNFDREIKYSASKDINFCHSVIGNDELCWWLMSITKCLCLLLLSNVLSDISSKLKKTLGQLYINGIAFFCADECNLFVPSTLTKSLTNDFFLLLPDMNCCDSLIDHSLNFLVYFIVCHFFSVFFLLLSLPQQKRNCIHKDAHWMIYSYLSLLLYFSIHYTMFDLWNVVFLPF